MRVMLIEPSCLRNWIAAGIEALEVHVGPCQAHRKVTWMAIPKDQFAQETRRPLLVHVVSSALLPAINTSTCSLGVVVRPSPETQLYGVGHLLIRCCEWDVRRDKIAAPFCGIVVCDWLERVMWRNSILQPSRPV